MNFIAEISNPTELSKALPSKVDACIAPITSFSHRIQASGEGDAPNVFLRAGDAGRDLVELALHHHAFAIHAPRGQPDLDEASARLRVMEAKAGRQDGETRLIIFRFPDLASLSGGRDGFLPSARIFALAHDEDALHKSLTHETDITAAPLLYARARIIADARAAHSPAYLKPIWSDDSAVDLAMIKRAKADGFDGLIGPLAMAALVRNA